MELMAGVSPLISEKFYQVSDRITIMSLTEDKNNLLMWSHYADQHRGFVVGFDSAHSFINHKKSNNDEFRHPRKVKYSSWRPKIDYRSMNVDSDSLFGKFFLTKSAEWSYEKEWRVIKAVEEAKETLFVNGESVCLYEAPHSAITEVIIGSRASDDFVRDIALTMRVSPSLHHVRLYRAVSSLDRFALDFVEIRFAASIEVLAEDLSKNSARERIGEAMKKYKEAFEGKTGIPLSRS